MLSLVVLAAATALNTAPSASVRVPVKNLDTPAAEAALRRAARDVCESLSEPDGVRDCARSASRRAIAELHRQRKATIQVASSR